MNTIKNPRIIFLDIAKGLAILFMFAQHCMIIHEVNAGEGNDILANTFMLLGTAPAAPIFMLIMGVFVMTSKSNVQTNVTRGIKLIFLGYFLNLLRFTIPLLISDSDGFTYVQGETPLELFWAIDILQLAGISIIIGTFIKRILKNHFVVPILIIILLLISPFLWGKFDENIFLAALWGDNSNIYFPFFPWFIYPLLGMYTSKYLLFADNIKRNLIFFIWTGLLISLIGFLLFDLFTIGDYHRSGAAIHFLIIGFAFIWIPFCYWISNLFDKNNRIINILVFWSKNVTAIYFIQWVLFGWSILIFDTNKQNAYISAIIGLVILIITHFLIKNNFVKKVFSVI